MHSRRNFIGTVATGLAGTLAPKSVLGSNDRVRIGIIGAGDRGMQILREASACPGTQIAALCDVYNTRLETAGREFPHAQRYHDHRLMLENRSIDAVLIATPQHLHAEHFVASLEAGKHVYQEKTMAFNVDHAKRMRVAYQNAQGPNKEKLTVQIGHQACSSGHVTDASRFLSSGMVGKVTAIHAHMFRNTPHGKPQWSRPVSPDMTAESILWPAFLGTAPPHDFDANRYMNWRLFWDYSGGNVYENMCHQVAFWYKVMNLQIPKSVNMTGGIYLWKDGREVPDTMAVAMAQPEEILFSWDSGFGNNELGVTEEVLGTDGTISRGQQIRYAPQKVNLKDVPESTGTTATEPRAHMQDFLDSIRKSKATNCPFDLGFKVSIACRMAVESYLQGRTVHWDSTREEII
jgi:predicted dehydrogenase